MHHLLTLQKMLQALFPYVTPVHQSDYQWTLRSRFIYERVERSYCGTSVNLTLKAHFWSKQTAMRVEQV